jgi:LPS-assembly lipoprotein
MSRTFSFWCFALIALLLSGCGFHLRGAPDLPFKSIYLSMPENSTLYVELSRNLRAGGTIIATDPQNADAVLSVLADQREKKILTLNTYGRVREYELVQNFRFIVKNNQGEIIVPASDINLKRSITYSEQQELSKQAEEALIYRDMQSDVVQRILRLMAASHNAKASAQTSPQPE